MRYVHTALLIFLTFLALPAWCAIEAAPSIPTLWGIAPEFIFFAATLLGVALLHGRTLQVALVGAALITIYKVFFSSFAYGVGGAGLAAQAAHEWVGLANLLGLLLGFALLSKHFERSQLPMLAPRYLPDDWTGGLVLLVMIFVLSAFLDNIAAALIGGTVAGVVFRGKLHVGYLAAIVAASNAGGAGSVVGDTTTTMMWIAGAQPVAVFKAYAGAVVALLVCGVIAARQQQNYSPIVKDAPAHVQVDWPRVMIVLLILLAAIGCSVTVNANAPHLSEQIPVLGLSVWAVILLTAAWRKPDWALLPEAFKGAVFLLALVWSASLMPVAHLPAASWGSALGLGFVSAVFDNIPLTALALKQGGYDWGYLAYAVGFGGSMLWFGSSAGVALASMYPQARSVGMWLRQGWHVALAYVAGFAALLIFTQWQPSALKNAPASSATGLVNAAPASQSQGSVGLKAPSGGATSRQGLKVNLD
jgi:Na+/H+ antiporter NhaD/arsenite permease-like protein